MIRSPQLGKSAAQTDGFAGHETVFVNEYTNGILDPNQPMLGPVRDGGHIVANTAPGCWGPMITPEIRGGHEVTRPVAVAGAQPGDAIAVRIKEITVTSLATASGNDQMMSGRFLGDPYVTGKCPGCGTLYPKTVVQGIGPSAIRCANCGADASPFTFTNGYTIGFDGNRTLGVTLSQEIAEQIARQAKHFAAMPENSIQNSILTFAPHDLVGLVARMRPFMGQLGTTPSMPLPDSHNAGDFGAFLIGAPHEYAVTAEQLQQHRTDGHLDIDAVRAGAILICPVKAEGGGIYLGDMHAMQGDGEIAGHTADVAGTVTLQVHLLKGLALDGPILFPVAEDLPFLAKPLTADEKRRAQQVAESWGLAAIEESAPISVIGTGPDLNAATENGLQRAATLLGVSVPEIMNRATITGAIEIGRNPGVAQVTFRAPIAKLDSLGLGDFVRDMYAAD
ncbi:MAG: acetamidase/formamidase family protein [Caldilineaceae bacterium]|nr:acetamidase/formamidase family protein [Caldilineaceae bacterium]